MIICKHKLTVTMPACAHTCSLASYICMYIDDRKFNVSHSIYMVHTFILYIVVIFSMEKEVQVCCLALL